MMITALLAQISIPYRWLALAVLAIGLLAGFFGYGAHRQSVGEAVGEAFATSRYNEMITAQKLAAAQKLADEVAKKVAIEKELQEFKNKQEIDDARRQKTVANLTYRLRNLADAAGRLRDPNAKDAGCGDGGGGPLPGDTTHAIHSGGGGAEAGGLLSRELSELLQRISREADEINNAYRSCREDGRAVRQWVNRETRKP